MQRPLHRFWIAGNGLNVGAGRLIGLRPALFPVLHGAKRNPITGCEFFLGEAVCPVHDADGRSGKKLKSFKSAALVCAAR